MAQRSPNKVAIICGEQRVDFFTLEKNSNCLANGLIDIGLKPGSRVALLLPNSLNAALSMVAIAKAGGIIVPVSTRLAAPEINHILTDADPFAVIYTPEYGDKIIGLAKPKNFIKIITDNALKEEICIEQLISSSKSQTPVLTEISGDDALLCYTSGTTGQPKGVISTHRNIVVGQCWLGALEWDLTRDDRMLCVTPMAHRIGIARLAGCFALGSTLIIQEHFDPLETLQLIEAEGVTHMGVVPTIVRMLLPHIEKDPETCKTLRGMLATGEAFPIPVKERLFNSLPELRLHSFYSQTEAGLVSCLKPEEQRSRPDSIGLPASGVDVRLVDKNFEDVPLGETGEVLVRCGKPGDVTVMREYYNRPEDNASAFVDGWLRTGDMARRDGDGYLYFVDRLKDMIISGGLNIYSREVENALENHPGVSEAAVIGVPDPQFGEAVKAFVICENEQSTPSEHDLITFCQESLASYKKPRQILFVDKLPRNTTGKVIKNELRNFSERV